MMSQVCVSLPLLRQGQLCQGYTTDIFSQRLCGYQKARLINDTYCVPRLSGQYCQWPPQTCTWKRQRQHPTHDKTWAIYFSLEIYGGYTFFHLLYLYKQHRDHCNTEIKTCTNRALHTLHCMHREIKNMHYLGIAYLRSFCQGLTSAEGQKLECF